jgi:hypothetical protein
VRTATGRPPKDAEKQILKQLFVEQQALFSKESAQKLFKAGAFKADPNLPPDASAASTILAQALLNHDATVWKR